MSVEFDTPANRIIAQQQPKNQFRIDTSLPDIAFLRQLSIQGRLRYFQGSSNGVGTPITITPNIGETLFIYKIIPTALSSNDGAITQFTVTNDTQIRAVIGLIAGATGTIEINLFDSLVGDSTKTFTIANDQNQAQASVFGWIENTSRIRDVTT